MKTSEASRLIGSAIKTLDEALARGKSEALVNYLKAMGRFHGYSFRNILLISNQRPDATRIAGFHTWRKFGRRVRRGERGITILAPIMYQHGSGERDSATDKDDERGKTEDARSGKNGHIFPDILATLVGVANPDVLRDSFRLRREFSEA